MRRLGLALALALLAAAPAAAQEYYRGSLAGSVVTAPVFTATSGFLIPDGTALLPGARFASEPTLGFWRSAAGTVTLQGALTTTAAMTTLASYNVGAGGYVGWTSRGRVRSPGNGVFTLNLNDESIGSQLKVDALPTVSACGAGAPAVTAGSTPLSGSVTVGTGGPTTCSITFNGTAYPSAPHCSGAVETTTPANVRYMGYSATTTVLTIVPNAAWADGSVVNWSNCISSK